MKEIPENWRRDNAAVAPNPTDGDDEEEQEGDGTTGVGRELQLAKQAFPFTLGKVSQRLSTAKWTVKDARGMGFAIEKETDMSPLIPSSLQGGYQLVLLRYSSLKAMLIYFRFGRSSPRSDAPFP